MRARVCQQAARSVMASSAPRVMASPAMRMSVLRQQLTAPASAVATTGRSFCSSVPAFQNLEYNSKAAAGVASITLNRTKALNALNDLTMAEIAQALKQAAADESVRCVILTGAGKAFAAGADIKEMNSKDYAKVSEENFGEELNEAFLKFRKPVIASVNGYALGGGCELVMMCDIVIASDNAKFGQPEITLGTIPGLGGTQRLPRAIGARAAMDWVLTGRLLSADEAKTAGLVTRLCHADKLETETMHLANEIAKWSLPALMNAKECVKRSAELPLSEGLAFERRAFHATWATKDRAEGMTAFVEKKAPHWTHK